MLSERSANEKVLHSFQQNGITSKVNTLCKLNKIIFALPSTLTSSPGNKSVMLQPMLQPQRTFGAGMKCVESGQVLLGGFEVKFALWQLEIVPPINNQLCVYIKIFQCFCACVYVCVFGYTVLYIDA